MTQVATTSNGQFKPSKYQENVFEWVKTGIANGQFYRHAVVKAVPGSGKSTTLIYASTMLPSDIALNSVFLAFNKSIEVELNDKLTERGSLMKAQTINAFGFSALRAAGKKYKVDGNKYRSIVREYLNAQFIDGYNAYEFKRAQKLQKMVSLARMTLVDAKSEAAILAMCKHYDIDLDPIYEKEEWAVMWHGVQACLKIGEDGAKTLGIIDFDDQVYLPIAWNLTPDKKDFIFIDECQDLNAARLELILRSVNGRGRLLFVGDPFQSIYGFSGADTDSINNIIARTEAAVLPLSICYRCPSSHIDLCASIFPGLEAREGAPVGTIETIPNDKLYDIARPGDLILCRLNAPLVGACLNLIRNGVRAKVRGSDIGASFITLLKKQQKQNTRLSVRTFVEEINKYRDMQAVLIGIGEDSEMQIAALDDRIDTMKALHVAYMEESNDPASWTMDGFYTFIENFFSDERGPLVVLSTVHKAKGLEEERVFILEPEKMPHPKAKPGWQYEQELNIKYVAFSRSKSALYFVSDNGYTVIAEDNEDDTSAIIDVAATIVAEEAAEAELIAAIDEAEAIVAAPVVEVQEVQQAEAVQEKRGRKALDDSDKKIKLEAFLDPSIRRALKAFSKQYEDYSEAEVVEMLLRTNPMFSGFFTGTQEEAEYNERQARYEANREAYRNRRKKSRD